MKKIILIFALIFSFTFTSYAQSDALVFTSSLIKAFKSGGKNIDPGEFAFDATNYYLQTKIRNSRRQNSYTKVSFPVEGGGIVYLADGQNGGIDFIHEGQKVPFDPVFFNQVKQHYFSTSASGFFRPQPYDLSSIERAFNFVLTVESKKAYWLSEDEISLRDLAKKLRVSIDDIYFEYHHSTNRGIIASGNYLPSSYFKRLYNGKCNIKLWKSKVFFVGYCYIPGRTDALKKIKIYFDRREYENHFKFLFTCRWAEDSDNNGWDYQDFQDIRRTFFQGEKISLAYGYQSYYSKTRVEIIVYDYLSQEEIKRGNSTINTYTHIASKSFSVALPIGIYLIKIRVKDASTNKVIFKRSDVFEVIQRATPIKEKEIEKEPVETITSEKILSNLVKNEKITKEEFNLFMSGVLSDELSEKQKALDLIYDLFKQEKLTATEFGVLSKALK